MLLTQFGDRDGCDPFTWASFRSALDFVRGRVGTHVVEAPGYRLSPHNAWGSPTEGIRSATPCAGPRVVTPGVATGRVVCANVASLDVLLGTPFEPDLTGVILALDVAEEQTTHDIRRLLLRLRLLDRLRHVEAIVFGRLTENGRVTVDDLVRTVTPFCGDLPLVLDLPLGHVDPIATLPQGAVATLEAADGGVRLVYGS
jgi:muramoyltetrapeptide carboxypeptidase